MHYFQNANGHSRPTHSHRKPPPWRIALIANLAEDIISSPDDPPDFGAEYDKLETVKAIASALEADGHWVHICSGDFTLTETLRNLRPDICFNIAEGTLGDAREARVPALCELLGIPYTASRVLANAVSLDKTKTKRIWQSHGLPVPRFQEFRHVDEPIDTRLRFPMLVKPAREGSGMGLDQSAIVNTVAELRQRVEWVLRTYRQPALVEQYLPGREFTVGFLGNGNSVQSRRRPWLYDAAGYHFFPTLEVDSSQSLTPGVYGHQAKSRAIGADGAPDYLCPASIPLELSKQLIELTRLAAEAIDTDDVARVDFRLDEHGQPHLLEINTLPGLNPALSDLCIMAAAEGMEYPVLITEILYLGAVRFGLPFEVEPEQAAVPALSQGRDVFPAVAAEVPADGRVGRRVRGL